jgi:prepilin-type N-terminal cleavage/methylation domain-containing protein
MSISLSNSRRNPFRLSNSGFTLIELIAVTAIIGIVSIITVPASLSLFSRIKMDSAQNEVLKAVRLAQSNARRYSESWGVSLGGSPIRMQAAPVTGVTPPVLDPNRCVRKSCVNDFLDESVTISNNTFTNGILVFDYNGAVVENNLGRFQIGLSNGGSADRCIELMSILGSVVIRNEGQGSCI